MSTVRLTAALADRYRLERELGQGDSQMAGHRGDHRVAVPPSASILG